LIIFMAVVIPDTAGLDTSVPQEPEEETPPATRPQDIVLMVRSDGSVTLNEETVPDGGLQRRLAQIYTEPGRHVVLVGADRDVDFQPVVSVIDIARGVGFQQVALLPRGSY
jgi:biopolymer transport protein ExbD